MGNVGVGGQVVQDSNEVTDSNLILSPVNGLTLLRSVDLDIGQPLLIESIQAFIVDEQPGGILHGGATLFEERMKLG